MDSTEPSRREMAQLVLRAAALPGAASFFAAWSKAQTHDHLVAPPEVLRHQPKFFSPEDFQVLENFTDILIPADETPGARQAHCAEFLDFVMQASDEMPETQTAWRKAMEALKATGFHQADADRRLELITEMSKPETDREAHHPAFSAYRLIKQQTAFAFYTSREGMIETLDYKGNSYNAVFPACNHPEHHSL